MKDQDDESGKAISEAEENEKEKDKGSGGNSSIVHDAILVTIRSPVSIAEEIVRQQTTCFSSLENFNAPSKEPHWQLVLGVQCSFIGQLFSQLEALGQEEESQKESDAEQDHTNSIHNGQYIWEEQLRRTCRYSFPFRGFGTDRWVQDRGNEGKRYGGTKVPLIIRRSQEDTSSSLEGSSRLFQLLSHFNEESPSSKRDESDWILLAVFIEEAVSQTHTLIDSLFAMGSQANALSPPRLTILLQFFRALGVVLGLGWRAGVTPSLFLPPPFTQCWLHPSRPFQPTKQKHKHRQPQRLTCRSFVWHTCCEVGWVR